MFTLTSDSLNEIVQTLLEQAPASVLIVDPSADLLTAVVEAATRLDSPSIQVLAQESALKEAFDDFLVASHAADLIVDDRLALRIMTSESGNQLMIGEQVTVIVSAGEIYAALSTDEADVGEASDDYYGERWEQADEFSLRTPPLSRVRETLREEFDPDVEADYMAMLDSLEAIHRDGREEVTLGLLVAARHEELLYDISKWGEDTGVASKATFSREKTRLEEQGILDTEKVPIDVGRPRLRLQFADEKLHHVSVDELVNRIQPTLRSDR